MNEKELQDTIRATLNQMPRVRFFRNNVGVAKQQNSSVTYGLAVGSGDLIGLVAGRFVSLEIKTPSGRVRVEQEMWANTINSLGGVARIVRSVRDAVEVVEAILAAS